MENFLRATHHMIKIRYNFKNTQNCKRRLPSSQLWFEIWKIFVWGDFEGHQLKGSKIFLDFFFKSSKLCSFKENFDRSSTEFNESWMRESLNAGFFKQFPIQCLSENRFSGVLKFFALFREKVFFWSQKLLKSPFHLPKSSLLRAWGEIQQSPLNLISIFKWEQAKF